MLPEIARRPALWAALALFALAAGSVFGSGGVIDLNHLSVERDELAEDVFSRVRDNAELAQRIHTLRTSDRELERLARQQLGMVRENEIVYHFAAHSAVDSRKSDPSLARSSALGPAGF